jgi:protein subunit release factor A
VATAANAVLEVRAGAGGREAGLFAEELFGLYRALADRRGWAFDGVEWSALEGGGVRAASAVVGNRCVVASRIGGCAGSLMRGNNIGSLRVVLLSLLLS